MHEVESCVRGYPDIWNPDVGDILNCERESGNRIDSYAVAIKSGASARGPQLFRITSMALGITAGIRESIGDS